ncbi:MAG: hypothetical protein Q9209_006337 [Squamulea sp. 1 TL-2023]
MDPPSEEKDLAVTKDGSQTNPPSTSLIVPSSSANVEQGQPEKPSKEELGSLRHIGGTVPAAAWLVALFSGSERFAFYALQAPLRGQPNAVMVNALANARSRKLYPESGAKLWKTRSLGVYLCGILLLLLTSIPQALEVGAGLGGLIGSLLLIGLGVGGVKSSVAPFTDRRKPEASFRAKLLSALACAVKGGWCLDAAEPKIQLEKHDRIVPWDEQFVIDLRQALQACRVWAIYPIAGQMITYGIPNDAMSSLNPLCVLLLVPLLERYVYPYMQKVKLSPRPTVRMALGFALTAVSMAIATGVQQVVYDAPPCYNMPLQCPASERGSRPNQASVLLQLPVYVVGALGEVLWQVSGSEYAYNKAAPHMKSTLQAVTMFTVAIASALGLAVSPAAHNPHLTILFASVTGAMGVSSVVFSLLFWKSD